jgi:hypothetical protein
MNVTQAVGFVRSRLGDEVEPYLWSNADLISYFNQRLNNLAERTGYYRDSCTSEICSIAVEAGVSDYALDNRIIEIRRVKSSWTTVPLTKRTVAYMDAYKAGWDDDEATTDTPYVWIPDKHAGYLTLWPTPNAAGTLRLTVDRTPLNELTVSDIDATPATPIELPAVWHFDLIDGVLASAYSKQDTDTYDPRKAAENEQKWEHFILRVIQYLTKTRQSDEDAPDYYSIYQDKAVL